MDLHFALQRMCSRAQVAKDARPLPPAVLNEALERCIAGDWTVSDLMETQVDELSTAASVGTGTARSLPAPTEDDENETIEKILAQFEGYRRRMGLTEVRTKHIYEFIDALNLPADVAESVVAHLKSKNVGTN